MRIVELAVDHHVLDLDPPFHANWDPVPRTRFPATVVRVVADDGRVGIGGGDTLAGIEPHAPLLLGTDPRAIERQVRVLETIDLHGPRPWPIEAALWDLLGHVTGQPVARLLGGATDRLAAYASTGAAKSREQHAEVARHVRDRGFRAIKLRVDATDRPGAVAEVAAVRDAVGDALEIMVDLNQAWRMPGDTRDAIDLAEARRFADAFAELDVHWLEEPLLARDLAGLAALRRDARVRIAGGEMTRTVDEVYAALDADAFDVHQPDVVLAGGLWRGRTIGELVLRRGRRYSPHTWTDGIGLAANLHVAAGVGGGPFLEFPYDPHGWTPDRRDFPLATPFDIDADGDLVVPDRPGLGFDLDEDALGRTHTGGWSVALGPDGTARRTSRDPGQLPARRADVTGGAS
ncbi:mandelate racemase/muconate lactonizing enzyme family protein [Nitriliruptoraceae bacterium ZYF776]|nr:mandelate racemase/muconate lactonizing enzyme family protein [Profundirhabdus halotolerans]